MASTDKPVAFTRPDAVRIARAVKLSEGDPTDLRGRRLPRRISSEETALIKITGNASGNGWYTGSVWIDPASPLDPTAALTEAAVGQAGADCYYGNLNEQAAATHDLTNAANTKQKLYLGKFKGFHTDGKAMFVGNAIWVEDC